MRHNNRLFEGFIYFKMSIKLSFINESFCFYTHLKIIYLQVLVVQIQISSVLFVCLFACLIN